MPANNGSLRLLVVRVARGDHVAFRALYSALAPAIYEAVQAELADPTHSRHIVRATFCEVWWSCAVKIRDGGRTDDIGAWIAGIALRRCGERRRTGGGADGGGILLMIEADHERRTRIELEAMLEI